MKLRTGILLGIAAALTVGGMEVFAQAAPPVEESSTRQKATTVPVGSVGDRVTYAEFERVGPDAPWVRQGTGGFRLDSIGRQVDESGLIHDVVWVAGTRSSLSEVYADGKESSAQAEGEGSNAADLGSRDFVALHAEQRYWGHRFYVQQFDDRMAWDAFGPWRSGSSIEGIAPDETVKAMDLVLQGKSFEVGQDLIDYARSFLVSARWYVDNRTVALENVTLRGSVSDAGVVAGHQSVDLRVEGCAHIRADDGNPWTDQVRFLNVPTTLPADECFTIDTWVSADVPYPLLTHVVVKTGDHQAEHISSLADFQAGTTPIPWLDDLAEPYRTEYPGLERSPATQRYPADGTGLGLSYPPSAAIRDVQSNPSLLEFAQWRLQNPDATLLGLDLRPTGTQGEGRAWALTYAAPDGGGFVVVSERPSPSSPAVQSEAGPFSFDAFRSEDFPPGPITFAAAQRLREEYLPAPNNTIEPNRVHWGISYTADGVTCVTGQVSNCKIQDGQTRYPYSVGSQNIWLGLTQTYQPTGRTTARNLFENRNGELQVDANTGLVRLAQAGHRDYEVIVPAHIASDYRPPAPAFENPPEGPTIDLGVAVAASASMFVLALLAYFFPALKFVATRGLLAFPGFSKILRSSLLDNKVRETMVQAIRTEPGITAPKLQQLTGAGWSTVVYHLAMLEKNKLVSSLIDGRHKHFFPADTVNWNDRAKIAVLKNRRTQELFMMIQRQPGVGARDLARSVGIAQPSVYWHMERLEKAGLVGRDRVHFRTAFYANPAEPPAPRDSHTGMEIA